MFRSAIKNMNQIAWKITRRQLTTKESITERVSAMSPNEMVKSTVKVSNWNKRLLVYAGRYKKMEEIPDYVPFGTLDKARNWVRVKVCNWMIVATIIGCIVMAMKGKREAAEGVSLVQMNLDWHKEYNEKAKKLEEEKK